METTQIQPKKQRVAAIAVIFAVLFQLYLASTAALNPTQVHNKSWLNKVQNEKVLLCTAEGFKWVDINTLIAANAQPSSEFIDNLKLHDGFQFECPLLQAVQFFLLVAVGLYLADRFPMTLTFKNAGKIDVEMAVEKKGHMEKHMHH